MDFVEIIITIAILAVGSLLGSSKKDSKKVAPSQAPGRKPQQASVPGGLFKDFGQNDLGDEKVSSSKRQRKQSNRDSLGQEFFSYESAATEMESQSSMNRGSIFDIESAEKGTESVLDEPFDLRKAVIYQAIMNRVS